MMCSCAAVIPDSSFHWDPQCRSASLLLIHESQHSFGKGYRLLLMRKMAGSFDELEASVRHYRTISAAVSFIDHAVMRSPQKQHRKTDTMQPAFKPRIVKIRTPGKTRGGFAGAGGGEYLGLRQRLVAAPTGIRIAVSHCQVFRLG